MTVRPAWPWVLAAVAALTAVCTVLYVLAPYDEAAPVATRVGGGLVDADDRIVALRAGGELVVLERRTGELSAVIATGLPTDPPAPMAVDDRHEHVYLSLPTADGGPVITRIALPTARRDDLAAGRAPALGMRHYPELPTTRRGPDVEELAHVGADDGAVVVTDLTTGASRALRPSTTGGATPGRVDALSWDPFGPVLYLLGVDGSGTSRLWRLDAAHARSLADAVVLASPPNGSEWVRVTQQLGGLLVVERGTDDVSTLAQVDRSTGARSDPVIEPPVDAVRWIDADASLRHLLVVGGDGTLHRWDTETGRSRLLATDVVSAAW